MRSGAGAGLPFMASLAEKFDVIVPEHPGFGASEFMSKGGIVGLLKPLFYLFAVDVPAGARTSVYLASSPEVEGVSGKYFYKCAEKRPKAYAEDDAAARRLWELSERLVARAA